MSTVYLSDEILNSVYKPARYTGGEIGAVYKKPGTYDVRFAFCFPDNYDVGMSCLGLRILYHLMNEQRDYCYCERCFAPWPDMEEKMRANNIPLFSIETRTPINEFDLVGFTLQFEMSFTNILNMLDMSNIPMFTKERKYGDPFVCAGGPCAMNPEPLADFVDFFLIGEGEEMNLEMLDVYREWKHSGSTDRQEFLRMVSKIPGVYVPSLYDVTYNDDGTVNAITPVDDTVPVKVRKRIINDLDNVYFPKDIIVPLTEVIHDRIMLELFRGCIRGCRFCQAGFIYRPFREKHADTLVDNALTLECNSGYEEISLTSLSTSDYRELEPLTRQLVDLLAPKKVSLSVPSLRVDEFPDDLLDRIESVRKSGLTIAPEAGTQRMRDVINKGVTMEDFDKTINIAIDKGRDRVKLYFMIGLPTETMEDVEGIAQMAEHVVDLFKAKNRAKRLTVSLGISSFVPKPFTPFQWEAQDSAVSLKEKQDYLKKRLPRGKITLSWNDTPTSVLEAVFARGDRRTGDILYRAWQKGCKFDSWHEWLNLEAWFQAIEESGLDPKFYTERARSTDEVLPWSVIDVGVTEAFLARERDRAYKGLITKNCKQACNMCGAKCFDGGICNEH